MKRQIEVLKSQLQQKTEVSRAVQEKELAILAAGKRSLWDTKNPSSGKGKTTMGKNSSDNVKIASLLEIIDSYKAKLATAEEEIQNLKRQKQLLDQDGRLKERKAEHMMSNFKNASDKTNNSF